MGMNFRRYGTGELLMKDAPYYVGVPNVDDVVSFDHDDYLVRKREFRYHSDASVTVTVFVELKHVP